MKIALTGGASGIGAELARLLMAAGHEVHAYDLFEPSTDVTSWTETDLSDPNSIDKAVEATTMTFDALINNAGLPPKEGMAELILNVNFFGMKRFMDGMLPKLTAEASIVNTASRAGAFWRDHLDQVKALMGIELSELPEFISKNEIDATRAYNLSKEAVIVMTHARCEEMIASGFRMNSVSPAAVSTGILDDFVNAFGPKVAANIKRAGRPGLPEEIADVIAYLISPQSHWIKGQDIVIDGGMGAMGMTDMMGLNGSD
ncbi:MAG: SDR family oxidoreductase [Pseudomonadota bacterium]